ncbi:MAG: proline--tRNA ligase, partial [Clostridia bacterium]|nr:proline--tRNA ligase [Clostridia bacterium]
ELGPRDIENNQCVVVRRVDGGKTIVSLDDIEKEMPKLLNQAHDAMYDKAFERREKMTYTAKTLEEMKETAETRPGFIKAMWCGNRECEDKLKEIAGVTSRCIPFKQETISDNCVCCGKKADKMLYWGKAY